MRRALPLLLALSLVAAPAKARAATPDPDPWLGPDKALHFSVSAILAGGAYGLSALVLDARYARLLVGGGVALAAGGAKELYDLSGHGDPSWRDFTWDAIGTFAWRSRGGSISPSPAWATVIPCLGRRSPTTRGRARSRFGSKEPKRRARLRTNTHYA